MKKHKKWLSVCLVVCLIGGLGGAVWYRHKIIEERKLSLIYIPKVVDGTNDFWKSLILGAKMAAKEYNAEIGILAPSEENDVERQNELLKEAIEKKPDAILFSPSSFTESDALLKEAKEDGIRIGFIDSYTKEAIQDLTVATDNLEAGESLGNLRQHFSARRIRSRLWHMSKAYLLPSREKRDSAKVSENWQTISWKWCTVIRSTRSHASSLLS